MYRRMVLGVLTGALLLSGGRGRLGAQDAAPAGSCAPVRDAQGNLVTNTHCSPETPVVPAAKRFPYPGESAPEAQVPSSSNSSPALPGSTPSQAPASKRFPYPGEADTPPASPSSGPQQQTPSSTPTGQPLQDAGSSGESSSSSSSGTSSSSSSSTDDHAQPNANDPDANDPAAIPRSKRHKLPPVARQTPSEREQEDVQVAGFYFNDGNFRGSYDRAKDAVALDADDAAAQLALGNAARKLGKLDEAERAYRRCLELDPVPKLRKPAVKALREMTGQG